MLQHYFLAITEWPAIFCDAGACTVYCFRWFRLFGLDGPELFGIAIYQQNAQFPVLMFLIIFSKACAEIRHGRLLSDAVPVIGKRQ